MVSGVSQGFSRKAISIPQADNDHAYDAGDDGSLGAIDPQNDPGVPNSSPKTLTLDAFAYKREAEEFHARNGADEEKGIWEDYHFKMKDGGYLKGSTGWISGSGAGGFQAQISCENPAIAGGRLEFRVDGGSPRKLIGQCAVGYTGGSKDYVDLTGPVGGVRGVHDLYLVAHGSDGDVHGHLFNLNWFTFTKSYAPLGEPFRAVNCGGDAVEGLSADQAYTAGGWGYEGNTAARSWTNSVYPTMSLPPR